MKKKIAIVLALMMVICTLFAGCNQKSDWEYIQDKGTLVIGYTVFAPMNYTDDNGEFVGFETEFAKAVCKELGIEAKFQLIDWNSKETELKSKNIDCIWNGMSITDDRKANMSISTPYMNNKQVMVVKAENAAKYSDKANIAGAKVVAEADSVGEEVVKGTDETPANEAFKDAVYTPVDSQAKAVMEVAAGTADIAVIDYIMSIATVGAGTSYENLTITTLEFEPEQYGIAFRKGDAELTKKVNEAIDKLAKSGELKKIADKYSIGQALIVG